MICNTDSINYEIIVNSINKIFINTNKDIVDDIS